MDTLYLQLFLRAFKLKRDAPFLRAFSKKAH
jgi:hypothetical protein